jgi:hypothetical protein
MRKSRRPTPPPTFLFVREVLPQLAKSLQSDLSMRGRADLAAQVPDLRIYGRCPCQRPGCGTFYCAPSKEYARLARVGSDTWDPVTVAKGKIIRVETLDPEVDAVLKRLFPDSENAGLEVH